MRHPPAERRRTAGRRRRRAARAPARRRCRSWSTARPSCRRCTGRCRAGTEYGSPAPRRGCSSPVSRYSEMSGPISWKIDLEQADVDHLPDAAVHRHHRGERSDEAGHLVGERDRRQQRLPVGLAGQRGEAGHRLGDGGEARPATRTGPVWPKPVTRVITSAGCGEQLVGSEAEPFERARAEVLDQHVGIVERATARRRGRRRPSGRGRSSACCG